MRESRGEGRACHGRRGGASHARGGEGGGGWRLAIGKEGGRQGFERCEKYIGVYVRLWTGPMPAPYPPVTRAVVVLALRAKVSADALHYDCGVLALAL